MTTSAIGGVRRNTEPHHARPSSRPPSTGPNTANPPPMPDQVAIAFVRDPPRNNALMMDSVVGYNIPAATPPAKRAPISTVAFGAHAATIDVGIDSAAPRMRARLRPCRSASAPRYSTEDANPKVNATATRFSCAWVVSSAAPMLGRSTFAMLRLMLVTMAPRISTPRICPDRWRLVSGSWTSSPSRRLLPNGARRVGGQRRRRTCSLASVVDLGQSFPGNAPDSIRCRGSGLSSRRTLRR